MSEAASVSEAIPRPPKLGRIGWSDVGMALRGGLGDLGRALVEHVARALDEGFAEGGVGDEKDADHVASPQAPILAQTPQAVPVGRGGGRSRIQAWDFAQQHLCKINV